MKFAPFSQVGNFHRLAKIHYQRSFNWSFADCRCIEGKQKTFYFTKKYLNLLRESNSPPLKRNKVRKWEEGGRRGWSGCQLAMRNYLKVSTTAAAASCHVVDVSCPTLFVVRAASAFICGETFRENKKSPTTTTTTATPALSNTDRMRRQTLNMVVAVVVK